MLGMAIVTKMNIGIIVHTFSKSSESLNWREGRLPKRLTLTIVTTVIITTNQTITVSCKCSSPLLTDPLKFWNPYPDQNIMGIV